MTAPEPTLRDALAELADDLRKADVVLSETHNRDPFVAEAAKRIDALLAAHPAPEPSEIDAHNAAYIKGRRDFAAELTTASEDATECGVCEWNGYGPNGCEHTTGVTSSDAEPSEVRLTDDERKARHALILALARADGQFWESIAEASEHTAEVMYGAMADAAQGILAARLAAQPVSETRVEWGVRWPGNPRRIAPVSNKAHAWAMAGSNRPDAVVSRTVTSYPDQVGEWTEAGQ